ncbi:MAG: extracellular solute-binding protein family 1, partial [Rhizobacter sp.]|nr:extracellular solute-binding protein family 1 [Rhizobacter sp.]
MPIDRRRFNALAGAVLLSSAWSGTAHAQSAASLTSLYEAAKKEGEVTWYIVSLPSEDADILSKAFTERYPGVKVNVVRTTAQVAFQRLNQDIRASSANCDVFASTDIAHYVDLKQRKLLMQYKPQAAATL